MSEGARPPFLRQYDTILPKVHHSQEDVVKLRDQSYTVHGNATSHDPSTVHHLEPFKVVNVSHVPLGESDIAHIPPPYYPSYETESMHQQHGNHNSTQPVLKRRHPSVFETPQEREAWETMAQALRYLVHRGYVYRGAVYYIT